MGLLRRRLAVINGDNNNNVLVGFDEDDVINAFGAQDQVVGLGGNDRIDGGEGNDQLIGGPGDDYVLGGQGQDDIFFGRGSDTLVGGQGGDEFFAYNLVGEPRGNQVFKYLGGNEGSDFITGFDPALDAILVPEGTVFSIRSQNNDTLVEFDGTRVTLLACNCVNEVSVITNRNELGGGGGGNDALAPEAVAALATTIPLVLFAIAALVFYRRPRNSGDMLITIDPGTGRESVLTGVSIGSTRTRGMSQWFYLIYGRSGRFSMETELTAKSRTGKSPTPTMTFEEAEAGPPRRQKNRRGPPPQRQGDRVPKNKKQQRPRRQDPKDLDPEDML